MNKKWDIGEILLNALTSEKNSRQELVKLAATWREAQKIKFRKHEAY
jgi:hypothetical protein